MLIFGTLPGVCFAGGMTSFLFDRKIRIFDYPKFAEPFRNRIRENAEQMAADAGIQIEFLRSLLEPVFQLQLLCRRRCCCAFEHSP